MSYGSRWHPARPLRPALRRPIVTCYRCATPEPGSRPDRPCVGQRARRGSPPPHRGHSASALPLIDQDLGRIWGRDSGGRAAEMSPLGRRVIVNCSADLLKSVDIYTIVKDRRRRHFLRLGLLITRGFLSGLILKFSPTARTCSLALGSFFFFYFGGKTKRRRAKPGPLPRHPGTVAISRDWKASRGTSDGKYGIRILYVSAPTCRHPFALAPPASHSGLLASW